MSSSNRRTTDRRSCLAAVGAVAASALAGCLGSTEDRGEFEPERPANGTVEECPEEELVEDNFRLVGRAPAVVVGSSTREWRVPLRSGEELRATVFKRNPREAYRLPQIEIVDPDGRTLVEERRPSSNHYTVAAETDGTYTVRVRSRTYTEVHRFEVTLTWFGATGCA